MAGLGDRRETRDISSRKWTLAMGLVLEHCLKFMINFVIHSGSIFKNCSVLFGGHTQWYSEATPGSTLRNFILSKLLIMWDIEDQTWVSSVQSKCPTYHVIALAPLGLLKLFLFISIFCFYHIYPIHVLFSERFQMLMLSSWTLLMT